MTFKDILAQVIDWLEQDKRITYRALKRQFDLDDAYLEDLKADLIQAKRLAVDEDGAVLVWRDDTPAVPESPPALSPPAPSPAASATAYAHEPLSYTPAHLAEKILTSRSALEGERQQVTVLFCDLANSTAMAEQIGSEPMYTLLNRFFTLALQDVPRFEGTINQFLGDGFMALFGTVLRNNCGITEADCPGDIAEKVRHALQEVGMDPDASAPYPLQLLGVHEGTATLPS